MCIQVKQADLKQKPDCQKSCNGNLIDNQLSLSVHHSFSPESKPENVIDGEEKQQPTQQVP